MVRLFSWIAAALVRSIGGLSPKMPAQPSSKLVKFPQQERKVISLKLAGETEGMEVDELVTLHIQGWTGPKSPFSPFMCPDQNAGGPGASIRNPIKGPVIRDLAFGRSVRWIWPGP